MHPATTSISVRFRGMKEDIDILISNVERIISISLTVLEIFALIVDPSLT